MPSIPARIGCARHPPMDSASSAMTNPTLPPCKAQPLRRRHDRPGRLRSRLLRQSPNLPALLRVPKRRSPHRRQQPAMCRTICCSHPGHRNRSTARNLPWLSKPRRGRHPTTQRHPLHNSHRLIPQRLPRHRRLSRLSELSVKKPSQPSRNLQRNAKRQQRQQRQRQLLCPWCRLNRHRPPAHPLFRRRQHHPSAPPVSPEWQILSA